VVVVEEVMVETVEIEVVVGVDVMVEGMEAPNKNVFNPQTQSLFKVFL